eukprot:6459069-Amphidinium_carterae.2
MSACTRKNDSLEGDSVALRGIPTASTLKCLGLCSKESVLTCGGSAAIAGWCQHHSLLYRAVVRT